MEANGQRDEPVFGGFLMEIKAVSYMFELE